MALTFEREIRPVDITQLKNELNGSVDITATVVDIALDTTSPEGNSNINITWNTDLASTEIIAQDLVVTNHVVQIPDVSLLSLPISSLGDQLAVHQSTKPKVPGKEFYLQWTGAGDDVVNDLIGDGDLLSFTMTSATPTVTKDIKFSTNFGEVYIHEGYAKWHHDISVDAGLGDHMSAMVMAEASALQQVAALDYVVEDDWVKYSTGGPGTGTHGLAATPVLIPRTFSKDGDWDYDGVSLTPNFTSTGGYKISSIMRTVHRYMNKIPMSGASGSYTRLTSSETAFLPPGYFIRIIAYNISLSDWNCAFMFEVYRERTAMP